MLKSGFLSRQITEDTGRFTITDVTSLTISNYGGTDLFVTIDDKERKIPAFNGSIGVPFGSFNLPGDGTACDLDISFKFTGGTGNAMLDYRKLKQPLNCEG